MLPHKYAALPTESEPNRQVKQSILEINLVRLDTPEGIIPVVATTEADCITVFWWNPLIDPPGWDSWSRAHQPISRIAPRNGHNPMPEVTKWNLSQRVGLTAGNQEIF
ncbi:MAG: hypothetical protein ACFFC6_17410, partial [Promethearchaeota archaeon]